MSFLKKALLLLAAAVCIQAAPNSEECLRLTKTLPAREGHSIFGDWVMIWMFSDIQNSTEDWGDMQSLHANVRPLLDNNTIVMTENILMANKTCFTYFINMSMAADAGDDYTLQVDSTIQVKDGVSAPYNMSVKADFYETCPNCMLVLYRSDDKRFLLSYRREGQHRDIEQLSAAESDLKKMAECLGFPHDQPLKYDGVADFCHKKSAPDAEQS